MFGWFDWFRENGAPTFYGENRTPVVLDLQIAGLLSLFLTPTLAFFIILPGIRQKRFISTVTFLLTIALGTTIMISIHYPAWHQGKVRINTAFKAFSAEKVEATLDGDFNDFPLFVFRDADFYKIDYNERVMFMDMASMERELERALRKGLPYPILKVIEYLSVDRAGFVWGRQYRLAGHYTCAALWVAFGCWLVMIIFLCLLPQHYPVMLMICGSFTLLADLTYAYNTPEQLTIRFTGPHNSMSSLEFTYSYCFYATAVMGTLSVLYGSLLWLIQEKTMYMFDTFLSSYLDETCRAKPSKNPVPSRCMSIPRPNVQAIEIEMSPKQPTRSLDNDSPTTTDDQMSSCSDQ